MINKYSLIIVACAFYFSSCTKQPVANFTVDEDNPRTGDEINFTNTSEDGVSFEWDFGDGETSVVENPSHTYESYGDYTVTLTSFSKKEKKSDEQTMSIDVDKNTIELFSQTWKLNTLDLIYYENNIQAGTSSATFNTSTLAVSDNLTYVSTHENGSTSAGTWNVITEDLTLSIDNDVTTILSLTETTCNISWEEITVNGSITEKYKYTMYMTKQ